MNVYRYELKCMSSSAVAWLVGLVLLSLMFFMIYPAFNHDIEASRKLLESFPPAIRDMFGLSLSAFFTILGFYAYMLTYIALAGSIFSMGLGFGVLGREKRSKTADFLLTRPVKRSKIFFSKLLAMLTVLIIVWLGFSVLTYIIARIVSVGGFDLNQFMVLNLIILAVWFWFLALGMLVSQLVRRIRTTVGYTMSSTFGLFAIGLVGTAIGDEIVRFVSPYKYVNYIEYVQNSNAEWKYLAVGAIVCALMLITSFVLYSNKDVESSA